MRKHFSLILALALVFAATLADANDLAPTGRLYDVRGVKLYAEVFGKGPPLVFLHAGLAFFDNNFAQQWDYFASFRKVIGIDRRGHGHSPDNDRPFSYREMAEDTAALIEQLGVGPVDVIGHSDGGNIGLILARDHPQLVHRLVISGANLRPGLSADELQRRSQWSPQQVEEKVRQMSEKLGPRFRSDYQKVTPDGPEHWWTLLTKSYHLWLTPVVIGTSELRTIKIPVLVIAGDRDFPSIAETVEIYRNLPKGQLLILPGTGHDTMMDRPELANLAMREFLEQPEDSAEVR